MAAALASPPSSQTMISSPSLSPPRHHSSDVSSSSSSDHSDRLTKIPDAQAVDLLKSEEYRQLFRLPSEETCLQDFNCALQENILLQGHMYLFDHYICFYSNIFGFETKKIIPFQDVTSVRRAKTAGIFPNAIEIVAAGKKHFFASFLSRDEAFKLIADGWSQQSNGPEGILDRQESRSEISSHISGDIPAENGHSDYSQVTNLSSDDRNLEVSTSIDTQLSPDQVHDNARSASLGVPNIVEEKQDGAGPSTSQFVNWNSEPLDAPEVPKSFTKLAESKFPISVEQFFKLFISDDGAGFIESFHNKCGDKDFRCSSWSPDEGSGYAREKNFLHPIKIYFGAKYGGCKEAQKVQVYKNSHLIIKTSQEVSDVPYADYFTVEGIWDVQKGNAQSEGCILQVFANVDFSKKTMFKGKIEQSTMEECREVYATWIQLAHELLKQKNIEKIEDGALPKILHDDHSDQQVTGQSAENSVRLDDSVESQKINDNVANFQGTLQQTGSSLQGNMLHATTTSISALREVAVKFSTFLRRQGNLQLFVVMAFFIILLLMQLSIVLLLSRPQPVYVIPQADQTSTVGLGPSQRAAEAMAWMEKRVHLLKDEMLVVEAQLERMRNEHIMLKAQLRDFERLHKQQR